MYKLMIVDDEENILKALQRVIRRGSDWEVETYSNPKDALRRAQVSAFDAFITDYRMPEMDGLQLLNEIVQIQPDSIRIILSGKADMDTLVSAINDARIFRFVSKPWSDYELIEALKQALQLRSYQLENKRLADQVREQQKELERRKSAIKLFEEKYPGITDVNWGEDGSIILEELEVGDVSQKNVG